MKRRRLSFRCGFVWRQCILGFPAILTDLTLWLLPTRKKMGFRVVASHDKVAGDFVEAVGAALELLERYDKVRFRRVRSEIGTIVNGPAAMNYGRIFRICALDVRCLAYKGNPDTTAKMIASALVYNATEGCLLTHGILQTRGNWERVQRLKWREARRFLYRLGTTSSPWDSLDEKAFEFVPFIYRWRLFREASRGWSGRTSTPRK
jgi:hypothetical protein